MFTGMIIGANLWFALFMFICICFMWEESYNNTNGLKCSEIVISIIIFSFVGGIIGYIFSFNMTIMGYYIE